jgi:autoinducer 2-degrading protein
MHILVVEFTLHADKAEAFAQAIVHNAHCSVTQEPGCLQFDVCRDPADPTRFFLYEVYVDDAAVQAHLDSAHFQTMNRETQAWVAAKTVQHWKRVAP